MTTTAAGRSVQAWAVQSARERIGMSREQLAARLTEATGQRWSPVMVRNLELGEKRIEAAWIPVLADILDAPRWFLLGGWSDAPAPLNEMRCYTSDEDVQGEAITAFAAI